MIFVHRKNGHCLHAERQPGPDWTLVPGRGPLFRRQRDGSWQAAHAYTPDTPLWLAQGWEQVRFVPSTPAGRSRRGARSGLRFAFAPSELGDARSGPALWLILPDEPGIEAPAERPGAQALFPREELEKGVAPAALAARLLTARMMEAGLGLDAARWVLQGPPVSPADAKVLRRLAPVLTLAERLSFDLRSALPPPAPPTRATRPGPRRVPRPGSARKRPPGSRRPRG